MGQRLGQLTSVHLCCTALGSALAGFALPHIGPFYVAIYIALYSAAILLLNFDQVKADHLQAQGVQRAGVRSMFAGMKSIATDRKMLWLALLSLMSIPTGQLSNAIQTPLVLEELGYGSVELGIIDASWPIGGLFASILIARYWYQPKTTVVEPSLVVFLGLCCVAVSWAQNVSLLFVLIGLMGFMSWLCKIHFGSLIALASNETEVGRNNAAIEVFAGSMGVALCLLPSLLRLEHFSTYYRLWGGLVITGTLVANLYLKGRKS
ncbi:hypothetical protein U5922_000725 (plasmid) [Aquicoccus sp. G2-2]|uniref:hypothetical protein n=1 Tax=Aquicoccus sp. G2-2 TaxID=3092120 RepID=UPI002ADF766B|nr:hypothetical protein [Aquicoccus sp. G2-2]MEA1112053.1 hypothetical protein [Aquicoccus sp. G2-2]